MVKILWSVAMLKKQQFMTVISGLKAVSLSCSRRQMLEEDPVFLRVSSEIINTLFLMADFTLFSQHSCRLGSNGKDAITTVGGRKMDGRAGQVDR